MKCACCHIVLPVEPFFPSQNFRCPHCQQLFLNTKLPTNPNDQPLASFVPSNGIENAYDLIHLMIKIAETLRKSHLLQYIHGHLSPELIWISPNLDVQIEIDIPQRLLGERIEWECGQESNDLPVPQFADRVVYYPPEYLLNDPNNFHFRTDIYSLGAISFFMLNGVGPFSDISSMSHKLLAIIEGLQIRENTLDNIRLLLLKNIISRAMEPMPDARFPDMFTLLASLYKILKLIS